MERAQKLTAVVFDKTGTLTRGEPNVTDVVSLAGLTEVEVLRLAAAVEVGSEHPLGEAIVRAAQHRKLDLPKVTGFEAIPGQGIRGRIVNPPGPPFFKGGEGDVVPPSDKGGLRDVVRPVEKEEQRGVVPPFDKGGLRGDLHLVLGNRRLFEREGIDVAAAEGAMARLESEGKTAMLVACDGTLAGIVAVADTLKPEAKEAVAALRREGVEVILLTGDNQRTADAIAREVGIDRVIAEVLPADKARVVQDLQRQGKVVAMVGDGVNDAPALAVADIGIAIGSGSDVAKETGGIILVKNDVRDVVAGIRLSRATMRKIKQNLFWAFIYNTVGIPVAALGFLNPMIAGAAMALSSLSVIVNSALLKRQKLSAV